MRSPSLQTNSAVKKSPIHYSSSPLALCWADTLLFLKLRWSLLGILTPWNGWQCKELDELYPSPQNLLCLGLHGFLLIFQMVFIVSLPFLVILPVWMGMAYVGLVAAVVLGVCRVLNGSEDFLESKVDLSTIEKASVQDECWIVMNGVSIGYA